MYGIICHYSLVEVIFDQVILNWNHNRTSIFKICICRRGEEVSTEEILRVWDELIIEEISDEDSSQERPVPSGLPRPVRWDELFQELRHRGISEQFIQVLYVTESTIACLLIMAQKVLPFFELISWQMSIIIVRMSSLFTMLDFPNYFVI